MMNKLTTTFRMRFNLSLAFANLLKVMPRVQLICNVVGCALTIATTCSSPTGHTKFGLLHLMEQFYSLQAAKIVEMLMDRVTRRCSTDFKEFVVIGKEIFWS